MGHMHARKLGVQSTKPKITRFPTSTTKKQDEEEEKNDFLEQREPPRPGVLLDWKERVGAHVVDFKTTKSRQSSLKLTLSNNIFNIAVVFFLRL